MPEPSDLFAMVVFSIMGMWAFWSGRKEMHLPRIIIGLALMLYPYFVPGGLLLWGIGIALTAGIFVFRE